MPKKINTKMSEMSAAEFGTLLQDGKIIKMRAGKAVIEFTKTVRKKSVTTTYHVNLHPQLVHQEVAEEAEAPVVKKTPAAKKPPVEKKPKAAKKSTAEPPAEKAPAEKKPAGRKRRAKKPAAAPETPPAAKPDADAEAPKKPAGRKRRTKKPAAKPKAAPPAKPAKKAAPAASSGANIPWGDDDELDDDDYNIG